MKSSSQLFTGKSEIYSCNRPNYPKAIINEIMKGTPMKQDSVIADIGSGTGILTQQLLSYHVNVYAVEPNQEMRSIAEKELSDHVNFTSVNGTAENTNLDKGSIDLITVAQAFHWFNRGAFRKECERILKSNGKVVIIYNHRIMEKINEEIHSVYKKYCPDFRGFSNGLADTKEIYSEFFLNEDYITLKMEHPIIYDRDGFIGRHLSASYVPKAGDTYYSLVVKELNGIFDRYEKGGKITVPNETVCRWGYVK
ncbi:Methyltransferase domain-containing protein [Gracilibacillus ureilyticus]|uniref:Methyltransferase domain-containing protein n=1 Tax=Gracilibacillus ureilyticus TaxID=531814 RepID=A0A1H9S694_9BACI|nr:class I SAM-dependent methyltransferase [Gracilibacillus ureilyticus]SER80517.1 Methyltransferase domain-containing protein [Gracilibacillus ureilyticus]